MVNKSEFVQWKQGDIFKELEKDVKGNIGLAAGELVSRSSCDSDRDQYLRGFVRGLTSLLEWEPEFVTAETDGNENEV